MGAGISGLACAYRLKQLGVPFVVLEAAKRPGGVIETARRDGFVFEAGPQCPRFPAPVWALVRELGLEGEFVRGDPKARRYIWKQGRLHVAPLSLTGLMRTGLVDLRSRLRILTEGFGVTHPPDHEESLAEFIERKFGSEVLEYLVDPFVSTVFLGDAQQMGMESAFPMLVEWERSSGSLMRGAIRARGEKRNGEKSEHSPTQKPSLAGQTSQHLSDALPSLGSFRRGMGMLPEKLAETLGDEVKYGAKVESVAGVAKRDGAQNGGWQVRLEGGEEITAQALVCALPVYESGRLFERSAPQLGELLRAIEYAPMICVSSAYQRAQVSHPLDGFGFMVPRREELHTICTFWNSSLFEGRAPEGRVLMTSFSRGSNGESAALPDEEYARMIGSENAKILGISGEPVDQMLWRYPHALPQYNVGHAQRVAEIKRAVGAVANLYLAGNYLTGRSIGECVEVASCVAEEVNSRFQESNIEDRVTPGDGAKS